MYATPSHVLDYHDQVDLDEQLLHGTAPDETFGRTAATPPPGHGELIDCPRCRGAGEIGFNLSRNNDPQCDDSATCPACHGDAMVTTDRVCTTCAGSGHDQGRQCGTCDSRGTLG